MFNYVAPYRYLLPNMYLSVTDNANPYFFGIVVGAGLVSTSTAFMRSSAIHPAGPHDRLAKEVNRAPNAGAGGVESICTADCQTAVTAPLCVGCVDWRTMRSSSAHVSFLSGVSKVSSHFTLQRSVETFHYPGFDVVIFYGKEVHSVIFQKSFKFTINEFLAFVPLYFIWRSL